MDKITLSHGSGGVMMNKLIAEIFLQAFANPVLGELDDAAVVDVAGGCYAITTDSFVVDPLFFPGGDIGKLAVCGVVNDLASCAAEPLYLTAGFIIEEGLETGTLKKVVASMAAQARAQKLTVVTGDTKVVPRGKADKLFINATGVGRVRQRLSGRGIRPQDKILINGPIAEHGLSILLAREKLNFRARLESDCNPLWGIVKLLLRRNIRVHFMRDPTRGGVNAVLHEAAQTSGYSVVLQEAHIPVTGACRHLSEILGLELLDIANEGKMLFFVDPEHAARALAILRSHPLGRDAAIIGEVLAEKKAKVYLETAFRSRKVLGPPMAEPIPRIC